MNHNFDFQGCQKMHIRVAISQKGLIGLFANCCHLMLLGPKEWKHKSKVLRTHFKNFFIPGILCDIEVGHLETGINFKFLPWALTPAVGDSQRDANGRGGKGPYMNDTHFHIC